MLGGNKDTQLQELAPACDLFEYTTAGVDIPFTELGGGCRFMQVISGSASGSLIVGTIRTPGGRTLTVAAGDRIEPGQYVSILAASTVGIKVRCYR